MAEFISRPRESQLAGLIAQMQARRSDPIAQGILQAGQAIGGGISAMGQRSAEADRIEKARLASESGRREGGIMELLGKGGTFAGPSGAPADLATLLPGIVPKGISYIPKTSQEHPAIETGAEPIPESPFFRDKISGMILRIKPGHKGNELVPLPGQSIGPDGKVIYTSDRKPDEGKTGRMMENQLRDELNKMSGDFDKVTKSYSDILSVSAKPSAAGDLSLIFSYMKMLDPGSTVREGEQATAANARGVPDAIRNQYNKIMTGEKLSPEQRTDFVTQAHNLYNSQESIQRERESSYRGLAERNKVNPENVIVPRGIKREKAAEVEGPPIALTGPDAKRLAELRAKKAKGAKK